MSKPFARGAAAGFALLTLLGELRAALRAALRTETPLAALASARAARLTSAA